MRVSIPDPVDVPEAYDATQDYKDRIHFQALGIIEIHKSLNENFWDKFKEKILEKSYSPHSISNTDCKKKLKNDNDANSKYDYESFSSLEELGLTLPSNGWDTIEMSTKVTYRIEQDVVYITNHINNAIMKFIELWNERPTNIIKKCQSESCARIFIQNTKHTRKYCKKSCGSKNLQREKREKDREGYNKYHQNWYKENISKA